MSKRFVAVVHNWFVHSNGFKVIQMEADTQQEADKEKATIYMRHNRDFSHAAVHVLELEPNERLVQPRRLSWGERLTGWTER